MNTALWTVQIFLGTMMLLLGGTKAFQRVELLSKFTWTTHSSIEFIRFVGISELLIGAGLILPQVTGILPTLTSLAAVCLCVIMVFAIAEHVRHKEAYEIWKNVIIIILAAFVAIGRFIS